MPDTQHYSQDFPATFEAQTEWIADNEATLNIQAVVHEGDIVNLGGNDLDQWTVADAAWDTIDAANIPYVMVAGNHDYDEDLDGTPGKTRAATVYNANFGPDRFTGKSWWNGGFKDAGHAENMYLLLTISGVNYIILSLEFGPRQAVIDWASGILDIYSSRKAIVMTHAYLYNDSTRIGTGDTDSPHDYNLGADVHDGEELWTELVKLKENIILVQSGHILGDGAGWRVDIGDEGNRVNQALVNFQEPIEADGGNGYLRVAIFRPSSQQIFMRTYSVTLDAYKTTSDHCFDMTY